MVRTVSQNSVCALVTAVNSITEFRVLLDEYLKGLGNKALEKIQIEASRKLPVKEIANQVKAFCDELITNLKYNSFISEQSVKDVYTFIEKKSDEGLQDLTQVFSQLAGDVVQTLENLSPCNSKNGRCEFKLKIGSTLVTGTLEFTEIASEEETAFQVKLCISVSNCTACTPAITIANGGPEGVDLLTLHTPGPSVGFTFFLQITKVRLNIPNTMHFVPVVGIGYLIIPIASIVYGEMSITTKRPFKVTWPGTSSYVRFDLLLKLYSLIDIYKNLRTKSETKASKYLEDKGKRVTDILDSSITTLP